MRALSLCVLLWAGVAMAQPGPSVQVNGMVTHAGPVALGSLKPVTVDAHFNTMHGTQAHRWSGPLLLDVVDAAGLKDEPGQKTYMRHVIMAQGADGYTVAIAIGEIDPKGEGKQAIIAFREDDKPMPTPRLVVPGDSSFARGVHELTALEVR
jgi:hypothetical protein